MACVRMVRLVPTYTVIFSCGKYGTGKYEVQRNFEGIGTTSLAKAQEERNQKRQEHDAEVRQMWDVIHRKASG